MRRGFRIPPNLFKPLGDILNGKFTLGGLPIGDPLKDIMDILNGDLPEFHPGSDVLVPTPWGFYIYSPLSEA
jgi:hypothetical protein